MKQKIGISFVIPVYRSQHTLAKVVSEIAGLPNIDWEIVLVNDDSPDGVADVIKRLLAKYPRRIKALTLRKNSGQHAALLTGFRYVTKSLVATIDDDGQNPPAEILKLLEKMKSDNLDIVYGQVRELKQSRFRSLLSRANILLSRYTINNTKLIPFSNVRLLRATIAASMAEASAQYNYIEGLAFILTDHIGSVPVLQRARLSGSSSYNFFSLLKLLMNHIIGYSSILLKLLSLFSFVVSFLALVSGLVYFFLTLNSDQRPTGWLSLYFSITMLFSLLFLMIGILTEYISRIYAKIQQPQTRIIEVCHKQ